MIASRLGMTSSDYVYIYFSLLPSDWTLTPWEPSVAFSDPENITEKELLNRKEIFQALKQVVF